MANKKREDGKNARTVAQNKYIAHRYDRINLLVESGNRDIIKDRAEELGESVNGYINALIAADIPHYIIRIGGEGETAEPGE